MGSFDALVGRIRAWLGAFYGRRRSGDAGRASRAGRIALGRTGERVAARHLRRSGYRLLARNFRAAGAEIDLIAAEGETIVFVEVKTRLGTGAGRPEEAVDDRKQQRIYRAAEIYLSRHRAHERPIRFDIVAITGRGLGRRVELFRGAF